MVVGDSYGLGFDDCETDLFRNLLATAAVVVSMDKVDGIVGFDSDGVRQRLKLLLMFEFVVAPANVEYSGGVGGNTGSTESTELSEASLLLLLPLLTLS